MDSKDSMEKQDDAIRYKRIIKEQVYLLKHASGTAMGDFLQQKLGQTLDRQLKAMVDGNLKQAFAQIRTAIDTKEKSLAKRILNSKPTHEKNIATNVKQYRQEMQENLQLIQNGERMLAQNDVAVLESVQAHKLLTDLQKAVRRDNSTTEQMIKDFMELDKQEVSHLGGLLRAVERLGVAKKGANGYDKDADMFRSSAKTPVLEIDRISFVSAFQISVAAVNSKISPFESKGGAIDPKEPMSSLIDELGKDLSENFSRLHEYASALFSTYNTLDSDSAEQAGMQVLSEEAISKLTYEAMDSIAEEFHRISAAKRSYNGVRNRLAQLGGRDNFPKVTRITFAVAWAMWVEKAIERALFNMIAAAKDAERNSGVFTLDEDDGDVPGTIYVD